MCANVADKARYVLSPGPTKSGKLFNTSTNPNCTCGFDCGTESDGSKREDYEFVLVNVRSNIIAFLMRLRNNRQLKKEMRDACLASA